MNRRYEIYRLFVTLMLTAWGIAANAHAPEDVMTKAVAVNDWFMRQWPDPKKDTFVRNRVRPSSLWTRGVYYEGLMALNAVRPEKRYMDYTLEWCNHHNWTPRYGVRTHHADDYCCSQTYIDMYRMGAEGATLKYVIENMDSTLVRGEASDADWWWIDAIQMGMPVLMKLARTTGEDKYARKAWRMYEYTRNRLDGGMRNPANGLWWRDKDFNPPYTTPGGKDCYWSRGDGWVAAALVRVMDEMNPSDEHYDVYLSDLTTMLESLVPLQREDGFWNCSLADPDDFGGPEVTGTSLFLYAMAWAVRMDYLPAEKYAPVMAKAWNAMASSVHDDGMLGWQQGTGKQPSDSQPVTFDKLPDFDDYGVGCFLLGATEYYRLMLTDAQGKRIKKKVQHDLWPDGSVVDEWFGDTARVSLGQLGRRYVVTDYGVVNDSTVLQTERLQAVIDRAAADGGGVVVVPRGTFLSAALFFRPGTHLWVEQGARLKAIDDIKEYPVLETRIEGETRKYFSAFINADGVDGFTIGGGGEIDGNGLRFWEEFRVRRTFNPQCTNVDCMRYRLVYISNSKNVTVQDVRLVNSPFWTNHLYKCERVRYLGCYIYSPTSGITVYGNSSYGAPSTDAIDIDVCRDVLVSGCYMSVNDDAVVLKGGKGTWADRKPENGPNSNIMVSNCRYGEVHGCLTVGSESLHSSNIILRDIVFDKAQRVLWLKMRPDTPQHYEHIKVERLRGNCGSFLVIRPWTQFFQPGDRPDMPMSECNDVTIQNIDVDCRNFFDVGTSDKYRLRDFTFVNCRVRDEAMAFDASLIPGSAVVNVEISPLNR